MRTGQIMRASIIAAALMLQAAPIALADSLVTNVGLPFGDIRIQEIKGCILHFDTPGGKGKPRAVTGLKEVQIAGHDAFNKAEKLAAKKKWPEAVKLYDKAMARRRMKAWMVQLVAIRRLRALDAARLTDAAVEQWFKVVKVDGATSESLALSPSQFAARGSRANALAITALSKQQKRRGLSKAYVEAISQLLTRLREHESKSAARASVTSTTPSANGGNGKKAHVPASPSAGRLGKLSRRLSSIQAMLERGQAAKALARIEASIRKYPAGELPAVLVLRGRAQVMLARNAQGPQKQKLLLRAGLNFMRSAAQFPDSNEAPEALLEAAYLHTLLAAPNREAAMAAYQNVMTRHPDSPAATRARKALEALKSSGGR